MSVQLLPVARVVGGSNRRTALNTFRFAANVQESRHSHETRHPGTGVQIELSDGQVRTGRNFSRQWYRSAIPWLIAVSLCGLLASHTPESL